MLEIETDLLQHKYMLAMPCYDGKMALQTATSLINTILHFAKKDIKFELTLLPNGTLIDAARNELAEAFLSSDCDTMICLDADMSWTWEMMERLLVFSGHYPIMLGAYQCKTDDVKFIVAPERYELNNHGLLPVKHAGFGFVALQKQVLELMENHVESYYDKNKGKNFKAFFRTEIKDGEYVGEDVYFFHKAKEIGYQPMLDPMIELGHVGTKEYNTPFSMALTQHLSDKLRYSLGEK